MVKIVTTLGDYPGKIRQDTSLWQTEAEERRWGRTPEAVLPLLSPPHADLQFPQECPRGIGPLVPLAAPPLLLCTLHFFLTKGLAAAEV